MAVSGARSRAVNIAAVRMRPSQGLLRRDGKMKLMFFIEAWLTKQWLPLGDENGILAWRTAAERDTHLKALRDVPRPKVAETGDCEEFNLQKLQEKYGHEHPEYPRSDWKYLVNNDEVSCGYWEWLWFDKLEEGRSGQHDTGAASGG